MRFSSKDTIRIL